MAAISLGGIRPCAKCGVEKPWTIDYFRPSGMGTTRTLGLTCRKCHGYGEGPDRRKRRGPLDYGKDMSAEEKRAAYWDLHREELYEKVRQRRRDNPDHARELDRKYYLQHYDAKAKARKERWANRDVEKTKADYKRWREANQERIRDYMREYEPKWREANREASRAKTKRWRERNPGKAHHSVQAYWARKHGAEGSHTFAQKRELFEKQRGLCAYCGVALENGFHADHFIPLAKGGSDYISNIRLACPNCNCRKSDKMPWEWLPDKFSAP